MFKKITITFFIFQLLIAWVAALAFSYFTNSLAHQKDWIASKNLLEEKVIGSTTFFHHPKTLEHGQVNLGSWHGYQEIILKKKVLFQKISYDFYLDTESYLAFIFNKTPDQFSGIRLRSTPYFPNILFSAKSSGEFLIKQKLPVPALSKGWHHAEIKSESGL